MTPYRGWPKRTLDLLGALVLLVPTAPLLLLLALISRVLQGSPVLFRQRRPGLDGEVFGLIKFRTMSNARDAHGELLPDAERMTRFGNFLRRTSLDELPELLNVLRGEMSLVGPRPLLVDYLPLYSERHRRRHEVRPGITGWAQVNGRNSVSWPERLEMDVWYVEHVSPWLDLKILLSTVAIVFRSRGVSAEGHATMPRFLGSDHYADYEGEDCR